MIIAKDVNGVNYGLRFGHYHAKKREGTYCTILRSESGIFKEDAEVVSTFKTRVHASDAFNKVVGRKIALQNAIQLAQLDRDIRIKLWDAYKQNCKLVD